MKRRDANHIAYNLKVYRRMLASRIKTTDEQYAKAILIATNHLLPLSYSHEDLMRFASMMAYRFRAALDDLRDIREESGPLTAGAGRGKADPAGAADRQFHGDYYEYHSESVKV